MQRKDGQNIPVQIKNKTKAIFVSVNNMAREFLNIDCKEVKLQKLNVVYDYNENKIFLIILKTSNEIQLMEIDTQMGNRTQIFNEDQLSDFNFYIKQIFKHEAKLQVSLSYSK
jgi:hypothetical protein